MADFGTILNADNTTLKLYCNSVEAKNNIYINGVPVGGSGNPNVLVSSNPLVPPVDNSVVVFTGVDSNFDCKSQDILVVDTNTNAVKINDVASSEFTTISTNGATYITHNGGSSGLVLDGGSGDLTLTNTKISGVVNINTSNGLSFNNTGLIKNDGIDLRMYNGDGNTLIESKQNNVFLRVGDNLKYENGLTSALYNIVPTAQPTDNSIVQYQANGDCAFIPTPSGGGSAGALINTDYLNDAPLGSTFIFDGTNGTNGTPTNLLTVDTGNSNISLNVGDYGGNSSRVNIGTTNCFLQNDTDELIVRSQTNSVGIQSATNDVVLSAVNGVVKVRSDNGLVIRNNTTTNETTLQQQNDNNFVISNPNGSINLNAPSGTKIDTSLRLVAPANTNFIEGTLLMDANENLQISNGSALGGNIVLSGTGDVRNNTTYGLVLKNLGRLNVDTGVSNLFTVSNDSGAIRLYTDYEISLQSNTSKCNIVNDTGLTIKDRQTNFESNIKQNGNSGNLEFTNSNGGMDVYSNAFKLLSQSNANSYTLPNPTTAPNDGDIIVFSGGVGSFVSPTVPNITQSFYVSKTGSDTNNGSAVAPFLTITYALSQADLLSASTKTTIYVFAGIYDESFTISKNNLTLSGASAIPQQTVINGVISYNIDGAGSNINSSLFGLTINGINFFGSSYNDTGSFVVGACVLGSNSLVVPLNIVYSGSGNRDYTLNNTVIYGVDTNSVYINKGTINATACLFTETTTSNIYPIVEVIDSGVLNLFGTVVLSLNATASAPPCIRFTNNVSTSCQFNSSTIGYAFGTVDTQVVKTKVCVACQNSASLTLTVFNNKFDGAGTRIAYVGVNYVVISKEGGGNLTINYAQNIGTNVSSGVHHLPVVAGTTRNQLLTVV